MSQENLENQMGMNPYESPRETDAKTKTFGEYTGDFFNRPAKDWEVVLTTSIVVAYGIYNILAMK